MAGRVPKLRRTVHSRNNWDDDYDDGWAIYTPPAGSSAGEEKVKQHGILNFGSVVRHITDSRQQIRFTAAGGVDVYPRSKVQEVPFSIFQSAPWLYRTGICTL